MSSISWRPHGQGAGKRALEPPGRSGPPWAVISMASLAAWILAWSDDGNRIAIGRCRVRGMCRLNGAGYFGGGRVGVRRVHLIDRDAPFGQQLFHVTVGTGTKRTATKITSGGNRNPAKLDRGAGTRE